MACPTTELWVGSPGRLTSVDVQSEKLGRIPYEHPKQKTEYKHIPRRAAAGYAPLDYNYHHCRWRPSQRGGTCVPHTIAQVRASGPVTAPIPDPYVGYSFCIKNDYWTENDNDFDMEFGTSVDAGMKWGVSEGWWEGFEWIEDLETMLRTLETQMVANGTWWTDAMFATDSKGFLRFEGDIVGGHAWATYGFNRKIPYRVKGIGTASYAIRHGVTASAQSWGVPWGKDGKGTFLMTFDDHESLIQAQGECATPTKERK